MILYLIKSTLCLAIVLGIYLLIFEKEKIHQFNRWYLLFGLGFSFLIPFMEIGISIDVFNTLHLSELAYGTSDKGIEVISTAQPENTFKNESVNNFSIFSLLTWAYLTICCLLLIRFCYKLGLLFNKAFSHQKVNYKNATLVLLKEKVLPHTFGKYIFISQKDYVTKNIETSVFTHELTHAKQWHSIDIILIEALHVLFWFNPFLISYKKAIQLNHEFLADEQVVLSHPSVREYQELLLNMATIKEVYLTSNINFFVTKKRLTMMTKKISKKRAYLLSSMTLPLFAVLLLTFSCAQDEQNGIPDSITQEEKLKDDYYQNVTVIQKNIEGETFTTPYLEMTSLEKETLPVPASSQIGQELPDGTSLYQNEKLDRVYTVLPKAIGQNTSPTSTKSIDQIMESAESGTIYLKDGKEISAKESVELSKDKRQYERIVKYINKDSNQPVKHFISSEKLNQTKSSN